MSKASKTPVKLPPFETEMQLIKSGKRTDWSHEYYRIENLHAQGLKGRGVKVAVLDTGVDLSHNSFKKAIDEGRLRAVDARAGQNQPNDKSGHGTWCVSRYISDGRDVLGFAPECTVTSYKVLNDNGSGSLSNVMRGVRMAARDGANIISTSLGTSANNRKMAQLVEDLKNSGIVWVSAAGNDGTKGDIDYPAAYDGTYAIGSHNANSKRSRFSDWGVALDVYSSGEKVLGAYTRNREAYLQGTSMATPSFGALLSLVFFDVVKKYGKINREVLKNLVECL